jgi:hypothetical protein
MKLPVKPLHRRRARSRIERAGFRVEVQGEVVEAADTRGEVVRGWQGPHKLRSFHRPELQCKNCQCGRMRGAVEKMVGGLGSSVAGRADIIIDRIDEALVRSQGRAFP